MTPQLSGQDGGVRVRMGLEERREEERAEGKEEPDTACDLWQIVTALNSATLLTRLLVKYSIMSEHFKRRQAGYTILVT